MSDPIASFLVRSRICRLHPFVVRRSDPPRGSRRTLNKQTYENEEQQAANDRRRYVHRNGRGGNECGSRGNRLDHARRALQDLLVQEQIVEMIRGL
jgi:hypothetical protein